MHHEIISYQQDQGGDIASAPQQQLEDFLVQLLAINHICDVPLAPKGLIRLSQHFLPDEVPRRDVVGTPF